MDYVPMKISLGDLAPFSKICHKICLNIPDAYCWQWDQKRNMAAIVLDEEDAEMVFYPLFKEFRNHWNFSSIDDAAEAVNDYIQAEFGMMPGQVVFTSHMVSNLVLGVAWWPWGSDNKVSMRVGLIPVKVKLSGDFAQHCLSRWLPLQT
jgi:hypothetical protein